MYKLVSFDVCPYAQRSMIVLQEKQAQYEIEYIDLDNKPDWFVRMSPMGKVPILLTDDRVIFESAAINEYLDETLPGRKLHPEDALQRAHNRAWIEFISSLLADRNRLQQAQNEDQARRLARHINQQLMFIDGQKRAGRFFNGNDFSLVDAAAAPLLQRLYWLQELTPDLGLFDDLKTIHDWQLQLQQHQSVRQSATGDIRQRYLRHLQTNWPTGWFARQLTENSN